MTWYNKNRQSSLSGGGDDPKGKGGGDPKKKKAEPIFYDKERKWRIPRGYVDENGNELTQASADSIRALPNRTSYGGPPRIPGDSEQFDMYVERQLGTDKAPRAKDGKAMVIKLPGKDNYAWKRHRFMNYEPLQQGDELQDGEEYYDSDDGRIKIHKTPRER